jgi:hypothetical protein
MERNMNNDNFKNSLYQQQLQQQQKLSGGINTSNSTDHFKS